MEALKVTGLRKSFKRHFYTPSVEILKGISFAVREGSITGFLGANGSGKTTTIKCILNLIFPNAGEILVAGKSFEDIETRRSVGFLPERPYFYDHLTGVEFLKFYGQISKIPKHELDVRIQKLMGRVGLDHAKNRPLREYSKGMLQRVGIAQSLIHHPQFVILDEPMTGLDPDGRWEVRELIKEIRHEGVTVFFSSHLLHDAELLCDDLVILKSGNLVYSGPTKTLVDQMNKTVVIKYQEAEAQKTEEFSDIVAVQQRIDSLRREGRLILDVHTQRGSLEDAFMNIAFDGAHKHVDNLGHS